MDAYTEEEHLNFTVDLHRKCEGEVESPTIRLLARLLLNGEQVGLVSSLKIEVCSDKVMPEIVVRFLEKVEPDQVAQLSESVKESVRKSARNLQRLPFIRVETPLLLGD